MKAVNITILASSIFAFIGSLLPMATKGPLYVDIGHIGGATYMLFLIPVYLFVVSILALNGKIRSLKSWYLPAAILGLLLALIAFYAGLQQVEAFAKFSREFKSIDGEASPGIGAITLICLYVVSSLSPFFAKEKTARQAEAQ